MSKTNFLQTDAFKKFVEQLLTTAGWNKAMEVRPVHNGGLVIYATRDLPLATATLQITIRQEPDRAYLDQFDISSNRTILDPEQFISLCGKVLNPRKNEMADAWIFHNAMGLAKLFETYDKMARVMRHLTLFSGPIGE